MSDKITENDVVFLAILPELYDGKGWHGKGTPTTEFNPETCKQALFGHTMKQGGVMTQHGFVAGESWYAVANDTGKPVGKAVGKVFRTPDNITLYRFFLEAITGTGYEVCSLGTLDDRAEFFVDAKGKIKSVAGREISPYFGLNRCFGGLGSVIGAGHQRVMQCGNTTEYFRTEAAKAGTDSNRIKNTLAIFDKLPAFKETIRTSQMIEIQFDAAMEQAAKFIVSKELAREAFAGYIAETELTTSSINRVNRLLSLFKNGAGNNGENGADWFNAVTDFFSHESAADTTTKDDDKRKLALVKQWYASEHGSGRKIKAELANKLFVKGQFQDRLLQGFANLGKAMIAKLTGDNKAKLE